MADYFVKYKNLAILCESNRKWRGFGTPKFKVIHMQNEEDFESFRKQSPYANCVKMDLDEQLTSKNLKRTLPKHIKEHIFDLPEVKAFLRDDKIDRILNK